MLRAAGLRATAAGNVGTPILEAVLHPEPYDVIAVELSSFQLHWSDSIAPLRLRLPQRRPRPRRLARLAARSTSGPRARSTRAPRSPASTTCRTRPPSSSSWTPRSRRAAAPSASPSAPRRCRWSGVVDDILADRAFVEQRKTSAAELATLDDVRGSARHPGAAQPRQRPRRGRPGPGLRRAAAGGPRRAARLHPRPAPHRRLRRGRRRPLRRRLQGHQPACGGRVAARLRARGLDRRRPAQGRRRRRPRPRRRWASCAASS